jgi:hypothetical protein
MFDDFITGYDAAPLVMIPTEQLGQILKVSPLGERGLLNPDNVGFGQKDRIGCFEIAVA